MSVDIELHKYDLTKLEDSLMNKFPNNITDRHMLTKILKEFGTIVGGSYIILNNEYYEDGNCFYNVSKVIERVFKLSEIDGYSAYQVKQVFDIFLEEKEDDDIVDYKETWQALSNLGIEE